MAARVKDRHSFAEVTLRFSHGSVKENEDISEDRSQPPAILHPTLLPQAKNIRALRSVQVEGTRYQSSGSSSEEIARWPPVRARPREPVRRAAVAAPAGRTPAPTPPHPKQSQTAGRFGRSHSAIPNPPVGGAPHRPRQKRRKHAGHWNVDRNVQRHSDPCSTCSTSSVVRSAPQCLSNDVRLT